MASNPSENPPGPARLVPKVLNVGGGDKAIAIPPYYQGWQHDLLDIDPRRNPDIVLDARQLLQLPGGTYDSVYCSHNLEHFFRHDVFKVVRGIYHVLKADGFAHIRVPDLDALMRTLLERKLDVDDVVYESAMGPITGRDVIYGFAREIERSGNDYFAHKTGFTPKSLPKILHECGFRWVYTGTGNLEIMSLAFKADPTAAQRALLGILPPTQSP